MKIGNSPRKIVGVGLVALGLAGCSSDGSKLRMKTQECPGEYREQGRVYRGFELGLPLNLQDHFNYVTLRLGDTTFVLRDYTTKTVDWNQLEAKRDLREGSIDEMVINLNSTHFSETITPSDSNSNTISGRRARDWLIRGNNLYLRTRECFVDWARRDYQRRHLQP